MLKDGFKMILLNDFVYIVMLYIFILKFEFKVCVFEYFWFVEVLGEGLIVIDYGKLMFEIWLYCLCEV